MLHLINLEPEPAYTVPFVVDRSDAPRFRLTNIGTEAARAITLTLLGPGVMLANAPNHLAPGETLEFTVRGENLAQSTVAIVRWFRADESEYLWRVSF
ncbi:MAG: hypothetical protein KF680_02645 [Cryobacterium sp.]|nr:hypothetical protein [Cryobacterium sp.]